ncbi:(4Fe-4S)-binding protein [Paenibacillus beijingensis]|uniref:(4Fe-4S)-binding protein n=1 Tax=Paenibacillus beijingensis TaxID=1126833 RepID=UPI0009E3B186|nr:(4Fe-4S)-binding protein [Paenibacillus beijingensis]
MSDEVKRYTGEHIDVLFHPERCIHSANCVRGLPEVFNVKRKPWVNADGESADKIAALIDTCPSGALQYIRKDNEAGNA